MSTIVLSASLSKKNSGLVVNSKKLKNQVFRGNVANKKDAFCSFNEMLFYTENQFISNISKLCAENNIS